MSEELTIEAPRRGRPPRAEQTAEVRRRRRPDSLDHLVGSSLSVPAELRDPDYHYHWANDERGRLRALTVHDDYDFVTADELLARDPHGFDKDAFTTESDGRVSVVVQGRGPEALKAYLLKKPQAFYDHDYAQGVNSRQSMMEARVYDGEMASDAEQRESLDPSTTYVPKGNTLGDTAPRRKGPIPRRFK